jgi:hypothetical protein
MRPERHGYNAEPLLRSGDQDPTQKIVARVYGQIANIALRRKETKNI